MADEKEQKKPYTYTGAKAHEDLSTGKVIKKGDTIFLTDHAAKRMADRLEAPKAPKAEPAAPVKAKSGKGGKEAPEQTAPTAPKFPKDLGNGEFELSDGSKHKASAQEAAELQKILDDEAKG
jgi:hypothetical protein